MKTEKYNQGSSKVLKQKAIELLNKRGTDLLEFCEGDKTKYNHIYGRLTAESPNKFFIDEVFNQIDPTITLEQKEEKVYPIKFKKSK